MLFTKFLCLLAFPSVIVASTEIATLDYFVLAFTPTRIITSRYNADESIEINEYLASQQYLLRYRETTQKIAKHEDRAERVVFNDTDYNTTVSLFRNAIAPVTHDLQSKLGFKPIYASLFLPSIFHYDVISAAATAILPAWEEGIETVHGTHRRAALFGFRFLEGKHIGPAPEECDGYCPETLVLMLEYEKEYLYAWMIIVDHELGSYPTQAQKLCGECGESERDKIGHVEYQRQLSDLLRVFIGESLPSYFSRDDIQAIVIAGEASATGISELGSTALKAVDTDTIKLLTAIEPEDVVAHGAAVWAQKSHQDPDAWWSCPSRIFLAQLANGHNPMRRVGDDIPIFNKLIGSGDVPMYNKLVGSGDGAPS